MVAQGGSHTKRLVKKAVSIMHVCKRWPSHKNLANVVIKGPCGAMPCFYMLTQPAANVFQDQHVLVVGVCAA